MYLRLLMCTLFSGMQKPPENALHDAQFHKHSAMFEPEHHFSHEHSHHVYCRKGLLKLCMVSLKHDVLPPTKHEMT